MILNVWTGKDAVMATPADRIPDHIGGTTLYYIKTEFQSWLLWEEWR